MLHDLPIAKEKYPQLNMFLISYIWHYWKGFCIQWTVVWWFNWRAFSYFWQNIFISFFLKFSSKIFIIEITSFTRSHLKCSSLCLEPNPFYSWQKLQAQLLPKIVFIFCVRYLILIQANNFHWFFFLLLRANIIKKKFHSFWGTSGFMLHGWII